MEDNENNNRKYSRSTSQRSTQYINADEDPQISLEEQQPPQQSSLTNNNDNDNDNTVHNNQNQNQNQNGNDVITQSQSKESSAIANVSIPSETSANKSTRTNSISNNSNISDEDSLDESPEAVHRRHLRRLIYHHSEPEDEKAFQDLSNALETLSAQVDLSTEENNRLYSKRIDSSQNEEISAVRILKCGVWMDNDGFTHRIQAKAEESETEAKQIQIEREKSIRVALDEAITKHDTEKLLSVKTVTEEEKKVAHRFYENDSALAVYELSVFAVYLNHLIRTKAERIQSNEASSGTQVNTDEETANINDSTISFIEQLDRAFHINKETSDRVNRPYRRDIEHNAGLAKAYYRRQLELLDHRNYYSLASFSSQENYGRWFSTENALLNERLADSDAILQSYSLRKRKKIVPREVKKVKKSIFSCCGIGGSAAETTPEEQEMKAVEEDAKVDTVFINSLTEQKWLDSYNLLLKVILQNDTTNSGMLYNIYEERHYQPHPLPIPTGVNLQLLDLFSDIYRIGPIYRLIKFAELLTFNLSISINYYTSCTNVARDLYGIWEHKTSPFTTPESDKFKHILEGFSSWSRQCLTRYPLLFDSNSQPALKEALLLIKQSSRTLAAIDTKRIVAPLNDQLREDYLKASEFYYSFLLKSSTPNLHANVDKNSKESLVTATEFQQFSVSDDSTILSLHIKSGTQLLLLLRQLNERLQQDSQIENLVDAMQISDANAKLTPITADYYLTHLWSDAQQFLQTLASSLDWKKIDRRESFHQSLDQLFLTIFSIHQEMSNFHAFIDRNVRSLPPLKIQSWFDPYVEQWLQRQKQKYDETYIRVLVDTDHFTPFNALDQYSISAVTLFSELYSIHSTFGSSIPFNMRHAKHFAVLITDVTNSYCTLLQQTVIRVLDIEDKKKSFWGFAQQRVNGGESELVCTITQPTYVKMNDIYIAQKWCVKLLDTIDFSLAYDITESERDSILNATDANSTDSMDGSIVKSGNTAQPQAASGDPTSNDFVMWKAEESSVIQLNSKSFPAYEQCETALNHIAFAIPSLARRFGSGLNLFVTNHLNFMVAASPSTDLWTKEQTNEKYGHVLRFYNQHFSHMRLSLYAVILCEIIYCTLVDYCLVVERILVHPRKNDNKQRLRKSQILRLNHAKDLTVTFFVEQYAFPPHYMKRLEQEGSLSRVEYLLWLMQADSAKLLHEFQAIDEISDSKNEKLSTLAREEARMATVPYLSRSQIISILQFRVEEENEKDPAVTELLNKYQPDKKGFFRKLFR